jgi:hypothetical protein
MTLRFADDGEARHSLSGYFDEKTAESWGISERNAIREADLKAPPSVSDVTSLATSAQSRPGDSRR